MRSRRPAVVVVVVSGGGSSRARVVFVGVSLLRVVQKTAASSMLHVVAMPMQIDDPRVIHKSRVLPCRCPHLDLLIVAAVYPRSRVVKSRRLGPSELLILVVESHCGGQRSDGRESTRPMSQRATSRPTRPLARSQFPRGRLRVSPMTQKKSATGDCCLTTTTTTRRLRLHTRAHVHQLTSRRAWGSSTSTRAS